MSLVATTGLCLDCNYSLRDLPTPRCPECGHDFDPADNTTFNPGRPVPTYAAWAVGPISWPIYFVAIAGCATTIWRARLPGMNFSWTSPAMIGWFALAILWIAWPLVRRLVLRHYGWPPAVIRPMGRRHCVVPLIMIAMVAMTSHMLPRRLAFAASRGAMDKLAADVMAHPTMKFDNRWVGVFQAKNVRAIPGGMKFTAEDDDIQFKAGFVYLPKVDPTHTAWKAYRYIGNGWWAWRKRVDRGHVTGMPNVY